MDRDQPPRLLVSIAAEALPELTKALAGHFYLVPALNIQDAVKTLETNRIDLILCGVFFDESRMFDLLKHVREKHPQIPFVVCRLLNKPIPRITLEALRIAAAAMGAAGFVDMPDIDSPGADEARYQAFREVVRNYLPGVEPHKV